MIQNITIKNYKSIHDLSLELGNTNVFIGENGCGKTNILEAVAMLGAAHANDLSANGLYSKGVRVTKPNLTFSSFHGQKQRNDIEFQYKTHSMNDPASMVLVTESADDIYSEWLKEIKLESIAFGDRTLKIETASSPTEEGWLEFIGKQRRNPSLSDEAQMAAIRKLLHKILHEWDLDNLPELESFLIYNLDTQALRGVSSNSRIQPLGIYGEGLDLLISDFAADEFSELLEFKKLISWLDKILIDKEDSLKFKGHKLGRSTSVLYFRDKYMRKNNNVFAAENSNEGVLHILSYLALFISKKTPKFFAIDNIETALNPKMCRTLMKELAALAVKHGKQALITTHNPAILDGINLYDDSQRLFVVSRSDEGHTQARRIKLKPEVEGKELKLSEMWMRGVLGGIPTNF